MSDFLTYLALAVMIVTAGVLVAGLFNMMKGGDGNRSQKLMRARVMLQGVAVILIVGVLLLASPAPALGKRRNNRATHQQSGRKRECEVSTCAAETEDDRPNCVLRCQSEDCYQEVYMPEVHAACRRDDRARATSHQAIHCANVRPARRRPARIFWRSGFRRRQRWPAP